MIDAFPVFRDQLCAECGKPLDLDDDRHSIDEHEYHENCCPMCKYENGIGPRKHQWAHDVASIVGMCVGVVVIVYAVGFIAGIVGR